MSSPDTSGASSNSSETRGSKTQSERASEQGPEQHSREAHSGGLAVGDLRSPAVLFATGLGSGLLPRAPGTWGSVLGVALWVGLVSGISQPLQLALFVGVFVLGLVAIGVMQRRYGVMDAPEIVIDEILGVWLALWLAPLSWWTVLLGFGAFRLFDIWKPWPVSWADRMHSPVGVMLDDVLAGLLAFGVVQLSVWALPALGG